MTPSALVGAVGRRVWLVVIAVVVAVSGAVAVSLSAAAEYRASATVAVSEAEGVVAVELLLASDPDLLAAVRDVVGDEPRLSVEAVDGADLLRFSASSAVATSASAAANTHAELYASWSPGAVPVERARTPSGPHRSTLARNVGLAALVGLALGIAGMLALGWRDRRLGAHRRQAPSTQSPTRADVRGDRSAASSVADGRGAEEAEAYRRIAAELALIGGDPGVRVLIVMEVRPVGLGSTVVSGLASAVAETGRRVVLVDADLRSPWVHRRVGVPNDRGLSTVLQGEAPLQECVQWPSSVRNMAVLTAGPAPDPAWQLPSERIRRTLEGLAGAADLVVVDWPSPATAVSPVLGADVIDAALIVTVGSGECRELREALAGLARAGIEVLGVVERRSGRTREGNDGPILIDVGVVDPSGDPASSWSPPSGEQASAR